MVGTVTIADVAEANPPCPRSIAQPLLGFLDKARFANGVAAGAHC